MKVLVNGIPLLTPLTGIGQYIKSLFTAMHNQADADIWMYYGSSCTRGVNPPSGAVTDLTKKGYGLARRWLPRPRTARRWLEKGLFRYHTRGWLGAAALYHEPNYVAMPYDGPTVLTVCDMSCFDLPETHPAERIAIMQRDFPASLKRADQVIVISEATRVALKRWFDVPDARITTTYLAADARYTQVSLAQQVTDLAPLGLQPGGYVLCVGTLEPRKNLSTLFEAYAGLPKPLRKRFPLVVVGMKGWHTDAVLRSAEQLLQAGELRFPGYVADALMPSVYAGAAAFCYPSRYEGFGLPVLEAMACGAPVLTTTATSLPEVAGDAGLLVDPDDVHGMRLGLARVLEDSALAQSMRERGLQRAAQFSWARCATETMAVYQDVLRRRGAERA